MSAEHKNVIVVEHRDGGYKHHTLRFNNEDSAANAVKLLRRAPDIIFAQRVRAFEAPSDTVLGENNEAFVAQMLSAL